jgi:hypothetical protein
MTLAQLADHFHQRELGRSNGRISYSTKKVYQGYLNKWIVPRWGGYHLPNIKAVEVELSTWSAAPSSKALPKRRKQRENDRRHVACKL